MLTVLEAIKFKIKRLADSEPGFFFSDDILAVPLNSRKDKHAPSGLLYKDTVSIHEGAVLMI